MYSETGTVPVTREIKVTETPLKLRGFGKTKEETINPSILRGESVQEDSAKKSQRGNMTLAGFWRTRRGLTRKGG